jgi:OFA family oxalate/formate antiporter-like MFS transporter
MVLNRFGVVLGACGIHLCIGSVYAWSVLTNPIAQITGWDLSSITFTFSIAILFLGLSAGFLGNYVQQWGPKLSAIFSCGFFIIGLLGSSIAIHFNNIYLLYLFYGVIGGIGLGIGYISPVATLLKWFPNNRGFAGGCAVMSFGFSALVAGPLMSWLVVQTGVEVTFIIMATIYFIIMRISSEGLCNPPEELTNSELEKNLNTTKPSYLNLNTSEAMNTPDFWILWTIFFINVSCGIAVLSIASPLAQGIGMDAYEAAGMVGMIGLLNGGGRIFCASVSDYIGRGNTYITFFLIEIIAFTMLAFTSNPYLFQSIIFVIVGCYGGGFSCMPAYISDIFGNKWLSAIHGRILTAWGFAGLVGPMIITTFYEKFHTHTIALVTFSLMFVLSLVLAIILKKRNAK